MNEKNYKLGIFFGTAIDSEKLALKFVGHLINDDKFCQACEQLEQKVKCDHCRKKLKSFSGSIYFYEKLGENAPDYIENPETYFPKDLPTVDFVMVVGVHQDILAGLPEYLKDKGVKAVIVPIEHPKWVPAGLQIQVLEQFEKFEIQAAFPKPFCALCVEENEYNKVGFNITKNSNYIKEFIDYFKIGEPLVSFLLTADKKAIFDGCVIQSAPCGSTFFIVQELKSKYINNGKHDGITLNERISKAHHSYPCSASMDQDSTLKDSVLHVGGYLIRNAVRRALNLEEEEGQKLKYVIK